MFRGANYSQANVHVRSTPMEVLSLLDTHWDAQGRGKSRRCLVSLVGRERELESRQCVWARVWEWQPSGSRDDCRYNMGCMILTR